MSFCKGCTFSAFHRLVMRCHQNIPCILLTTAASPRNICIFSLCICSQPATPSLSIWHLAVSSPLASPPYKFSPRITPERNQFFSIIVLFIHRHHDTTGARLSLACSCGKKKKRWQVYQAYENMQKDASDPVINTV